MFYFTKEVSLIFLEYCTIHEFVNVACLNKENLSDVQYYFKTKNEIYRNLNIEKTIENCLLYIKHKNIYRRWTKCNKNLYEIVKVVKLIKLENGKKKDNKIYYWCISSPCKIGSIRNGFRTVIYPNHCTICDVSLDCQNLIPFR